MISAPKPPLVTLMKVCPFARHLTKDSIPVINEALERLDDLDARLGNHHHPLFPDDPRRRLKVIRIGLRFGDPQEAFRDLQAFVDEVRKAES